MFNAFREWLACSTGKIGGALIAVALLGLAVYITVTSLGSSTPDDAHYTTFICTETGKPFRHRNQMGDEQPILSPYSGKNTGVPAEACYWNADGTIKEKPTWVLLNELAGKPGPTFCPDCGRLVVGHNPPAFAGIDPPPTRAEYAARKATHATATASRQYQR